MKTKRISKLLAAVILVVLAIGIAFIISSNISALPKKQVSTIQKNTTPLQNNSKSFIYLIYSPVCPHCEHLIEYLKSFEKEKNIVIVKTTKASKYLGVLKRFNFSWDGAVPLLFGIVENKSLIAIEGYPSKEQDINGYFLGKEKEQGFCKKLNGKEVFENKEYKFCKLPNNVILGNKYAVDYLINTCKIKKCYAVD